MNSRTNEIFKEIDQLILLVENSSVEKISKLKIIKVLFAIKLNLLGLLKNEIKSEPKLANSIKARAAWNGHAGKDSEKQKIILEFIRNNGGRVNLGQLSGLGIASRSLRRYIKDLRDANKIKIEKSGRQNFYRLLTI